MKKPQTHQIFSPAFYAGFGLLIAAMGACSAGCSSSATPMCRQSSVDINSVDGVLERLKEKTRELRTYQCRVEYLFSQPLLESTTLRKGGLYYAKFGRKSKLRIDFESLKQDDEEQREYKELYIFDGEWLTRVNYEIRQVEKRQMAEPNEPVDAFELAKRSFPFIGFTNTEQLRKDFEIALVENEPNETPAVGELALIVRPESKYKDDYTQVNLWVDKKLHLPWKIAAVNTSEDVYEITLLDAKVNQQIDPNVFEFVIPADFGKPEVIPLKKD